jgi:hypothetical protein
MSAERSGPHRAGRRRAAALVLAVLALGLIVAGIIALDGSGGSRSPAVRTQRTVSRPPPLQDPPGLPGPAQVQFGASVNSLFLYPFYGRAQIDAQLAALKQTGVTIARSDALWEATEPAPPVGGVHHYDWKFDDNTAGSLGAAGLKWLPIVDFTAPWASSIPNQDHAPPRSNADYAAYAAALASRYGPGGLFWRLHPELTPQPIDTYEIWNEPDVGLFWLPRPDPARYAGMYVQAREAIKRVDPNARVIIGGLGHPPMFLPAMMSARPSLRGHIDGIAVHPYWPTPSYVLQALGSYRNLMNSLGLRGVPMYVTEVGWSTSRAGQGKFAPPRLRPGYIETLFAAFGHTNCGLAAAVLYSWMTPERNRAIGDDWLGIHPPRGGSTPDTRAFTAGLRLAASPAPTVRACG